MAVYNTGDEAYDFTQVGPDMDGGIACGVIFGRDRSDTWSGAVLS